VLAYFMQWVKNLGFSQSAIHDMSDISGTKQGDIRNKISSVHQNQMAAEFLIHFISCIHARNDQDEPEDVGGPGTRSGGSVERMWPDEGKVVLTANKAYHVYADIEEEIVYVAFAKSESGYAQLLVYVGKQLRSAFGKHIDQTAPTHKTATDEILDDVDLERKFDALAYDPLMGFAHALCLPSRLYRVRTNGKAVLKKGLAAPQIEAASRDLCQRRTYIRTALATLGRASRPRKLSLWQMLFGYISLSMAIGRKAVTMYHSLGIGPSYATLKLGLKSDAVRATNNRFLDAQAKTWRSISHGDYQAVVDHYDHLHPNFALPYSGFHTAFGFDNHQRPSVHHTHWDPDRAFKVVVSATNAVWFIGEFVLNGRAWTPTNLLKEHLNHNKNPVSLEYKDFFVGGLEDESKREAYLEEISEERMAAAYQRVLSERIGELQREVDAENSGGSSSSSSGGSSGSSSSGGSSSRGGSSRGGSSTSPTDTTAAVDADDEEGRAGSGNVQRRPASANATDYPLILKELGTAQARSLVIANDITGKEVPDLKRFAQRWLDNKKKEGNQLVPGAMCDAVHQLLGLSPPPQVRY
jgi:uncharacterized membrane protein YgcG